MIELTRCYRFPAAHVLARDDFSDAENQRRYGKCANPGGHGHNYGVEVTVRGPIDPGTGEVMGRRQLDELARADLPGQLSRHALHLGHLEQRAKTTNGTGTHPIGRGRPGGLLRGGE